MHYSSVLSGIFIERPNRFIALCEINGYKEICHVKNTGRCKELLLPGTKVYLQKASHSNRKTKYDLIAVQKGSRLINMDSQAPNEVFREWAMNHIPGLILLKREVRFQTSRFDFYMETDKEKSFVEVKGVTLEKDGAVYFPDAPTARGVKHVQELCRCLREGYQAMIVFIIQMDNIHYFAPNDTTHPAFGQALRIAQTQGVRLLALDCLISPDSITAMQPVEIRLHGGLPPHI